MEDSYFAYALLCFTSFFTLVNPFGTMPIFLTMTQSLDERERARILKKAAFVAFLILVSFTVFGQFIFKFFGLSTSGFRIVGGIIIFKIGYDMLQAKFTRVKVAEEEIKDYANDISVTPLAIPILCGPGAIANGIVFMLTYLTLRASTRLLKIIGETGNNVMMRLMGLILMVIAVECFFSGLGTIISELL